MTKKIEQKIVSRSYRLPEKTVQDLDTLCNIYALKKERVVANAINEEISKIEKTFKDKK